MSHHKFDLAPRRHGKGISWFNPLDGGTSGLEQIGILLRVTDDNNGIEAGPQRSCFEFEGHGSLGSRLKTPSIHFTRLLNLAVQNQASI